MSNKQLKGEQFKNDFELSLNPMNRWVQLSSITPWDDLVGEYVKGLDPKQGAPALNPRVAVGSLIVKHRYSRK